MRRGTINVILLGLLFLLGLPRGANVEEQAFIISMALDRMPEGKLLVSIQVPTPAANSGEGSGGSSSSAYAVLSADAEDYRSALETLRVSLPHILNFSQLNQLVISQELAEEPAFLDMFREVMATQGIRHSASLVIARESAKDFVTALQPFLDVRLSTSINTYMDSLKERGVIPDSPIGEVIRQIDGAWCDVIVPYAAHVGMHRDELTEEEEISPLDTLPGDLRYTGKPDVEYLGAAVFHDGRMVGTLTGLEVQLVNFMFSRMPQIILSANGVYYCLDQRFITRLGLDMSTTPWTIHIKGSIRSCLLYPGLHDSMAVHDVFVDQLKKLVIKLQDMGVDPVGFEGQSVRSVWTLKDWSETAWLEGYKNANVEIEVSISMGELR